MGNQKTIRILIAEDDYLVGQSTAMLLRSMGHTIVGQAFNGREAVEMTQSLRPNVVLMDIKMPVMDGIEATRHIYETCPTPVVALTAYASPEVIERAIAAGVGAYLTKPASPQEMERAINVTIARFDDMVELRRLNAELQAEITERKQAEKTLRESEARYRAVVEDQTELICRFQPDGTLTFVNEAYCRYFDKRREELIGHSCMSLIPKEDREFAANQFTSLSAENPIVAYEHRVIAASGEIRWQRWTDRAIFDERGRIVEYQSVGRDITERKQAQEEIEQRNRELAALNAITAAMMQSALDLDEVLQRTADGIVEGLGCNTALILLLDEDEEVFKGGAVSTKTKMLQRMNALIGSPLLRIKIPARSDFNETVSNLLAGRATIKRDFYDLVKPFWSKQVASAMQRLLDSRTFFAIPMLAKGKTVGAIVASTPDELTEKDTEKLMTFANQAALAIENARLYEETQQRALEQETLREAALALTTALDRNMVIERILAQLQQVVPYDTASVQLLKENQMEIVGGRGFPNLPDLLGITFPADGGNPNSEVIRTRAPFIVKDAPVVYEAFREDPHRQAAGHSWLGVPMLVGEQLVGMIALDKREPGFYTQEHARLAEAFAAQAAVAIENARLFEAERDQRELAEALRDTAETLNSTLDFDKVLDRILTNAGRVVPHDAADILLIDSAGIVSIVRSKGYVERDLEEWVKARRFPLADFPTLREIVKSKQPLAIPDTQAYAGWIDIPETHWIRSYVCAPIPIEAQVVGFISLTSTTPGTYTSAHAERLQIFANQAAIAIENSRLYEETKRRAEEMTALHETALDITARLEMQHVLNAIITRASDLLGATGGLVHLYDPARERLVAVTSHNLERDYTGLTLGVGEGVAGKVFQTGQPLIIDDHCTWTGKSPQVEEAFARSILGVPLKWREQVIGVLDIMDNVRAGAFDKQALGLLTLLANQAAIAIENARLFEEEKRRSTQLALINEVGEKAVSILDSNRLMQEVIRSIQESFNCYNAALLLLDNERRELVMQAIAGGFEHGVADAYRQSVDEGIIGFVARTGKSWLASDVSKDPYYIKGFAEEEILTGSELCVPVKLGAKVIGALDVHSIHLNDFDQSDVVAMEAVADRVAVGIQNARLYEEMAGLYDVGLAVTSALELDKTLRAIYEQVNHLMSFDTFYIALYDEARGELRFDIFVEEGEWLPKFTQKLDEGGLTTWIVQSRKPLFIGDFEKESPPVTPGQVGKPETQSWLGFPLLVRDKVVGVISVQSFRSHAFTEGNKRTLSAFANQAAIAIENARLFQEIEERQVYLETVLGAAPDAIVTLDAHHRIVEWNAGAEKLFGYSQEEVIGKDIDDLITRPNVFEEAVGFTQTAMGGNEVPPTETVRYRKDGSPVDVIVAGSPILVGDEFIGTVAVYTDITARVRMEETLRALALIDDLTSLYNRRGFVALGQQQLKAAGRAKRKMILLFADFDGLKQINDAFGHPEGDRALIETANALRETFRESDILARIGGDEFVVLAIETDGFPAEILATRLQGNLEARNAEGDRRYKLSLSVGLARYDPERPCSIDELLTQADRAMYEQKRRQK